MCDIENIDQAATFELPFTPADEDLVNTQWAV